MSRPFSLRRLAVHLTLLGVVVLCCVHSVALLGKLLSAERDWPADSQATAYRWIERRVRGERAIGLEFVGEVGRDQRTHIRSNAQAAIAPTRLLEGRQPLTMLIRAVSLDHAEFRTQLEGMGFAHLVIQDVGRLALGGEAAPVVRDDRQPAFRPAPAGRLAWTLSGLLLPATLAGLLRGRRLFGWLLLLGPVALSLAAAIADGLFQGGLALGVQLLLYFAGLGGVLWLLRRDQEPAPPRAASGLWIMPSTFLLGLLLFVLLAGEQPQGMLDAQSMYNLRARFILLEADFWAPFRAEPDWMMQHLDYPPLLSFAVAGFWRVAGGFSVFGPIALAFCFWFGAGVVVSDWAARRFGRRYGWSAWCAWWLSPFLVRTVSQQVCDAPLAALLGCGWIAWLEARRAAQQGRSGGAHLGLCALSWMAALWTKNDALVLLAALGAVACWGAWRDGPTDRSRCRRLLVGLAPAFVLYALFKLQVPTNDLVQHSSWNQVSLERLRLIATSFAYALTWPTLFKGVFVLAGLWLLVSWRGPAARMDRRLATALGLAFAALAGAYLISPHDLAWHLNTSLNRVLLQAYLLGIVLLLSVCSRVEQSG